MCISVELELNRYFLCLVGKGGCKLFNQIIQKRNICNKERQKTLSYKDRELLRHTHNDRKTLRQTDRKTYNREKQTKTDKDKER